jgi:hypothetical protein
MINKYKVIKSKLIIQGTDNSKPFKSKYKFKIIMILLK